MKSELADATLASVDENASFTLEDVAVSAVLQQNGRPVAFWSKTLNLNEKRYASVEKEAAAIVEAVRPWSYYLLPRKLAIITDKILWRLCSVILGLTKLKMKKLCCGE